MRILYVLPFVPWPIRVRSFNLIPRLARHHEIHLACMLESSEARARLDAFGGVCRSVRSTKLRSLRGVLQSALALPTATPLRLAYCASPKMSAAVRQAIEEVAPDAIYVERWRAAQFVPEESGIPIVCDPTDSMILHNRRLMAGGAWWQKAIALEEYTKFLRAEPRLARQADATIFCSRLDMECVVERAPEARCELIPNGVDCEQFAMKQPSDGDPLTIVFTGSFDYRPNCLAVSFFLREIFPLVRKAFPEAKFHAVGNGASRRLGHLGQPGFQAVDFVANLRDEIAKSTVAVAPMTVGSGVSNKILESFATGTPIVATPIACGDLPVKDGVHLLVANEPQRFAAAVIGLLQDEVLRRRLTIPARRLVAEHYDWEIVYRQMEQVFFSVIERKQNLNAANSSVRTHAVAGV